MTRNAIAGAASNQLSGKALPSLILGDWSTPEDHLRAAKMAIPSANLINVALSQRTKNLLTSMVRNPPHVIVSRQEALAKFSNLSTMLEPFRVRWVDRLPELSPAHNLNFPMIHTLTRNFGYADTRIVFDLARGMPIAGPVDATPGLTNRKKFALSSYQEWKAGIESRNKDVFDRVKKSQGTEAALKCWEKNYGRGGKWMANTIPFLDLRWISFVKLDSFSLL